MLPVKPGSLATDRRWLCIPLSLALLVAAKAPAQGIPPSAGPPSARIIEEIRTHSHAMADLERLTDDFGPRLTGSEQLRRAEAWVMDKLREYGAENVHEEAYEFPSRWVRGDDYARLLTQGGQRLTVAAMPWNPATKGTVTADVVLLTGKLSDAVQHLERFHNKIVVQYRLYNPVDAPDSARLKQIFEGIKNEGAVAFLGSFEHRDGKLGMFGSPYDWYFVDFLPPWPRIPVGFLPFEHQQMLGRLVASGHPVRLELRLGGTITATGIQEHNIVGEIPGTEKPGEVVIVGGHLDSWDLATGATDNGTGVIATLETLRAMHALGLRPKRTLRFILFSGEEQGEVGSLAYAKAHAAELDQIQAILIHDIGGGRPQGFTVQGREDLLPFLALAMEPSAALGVTGMPLRLHDDSDQDPFVAAGVPGFFLVQDDSEYFASTHHSQTDTFDHVKASDYLPSIEALAATAWGFADMAARLPHRKPAANPATGN